MSYGNQTDHPLIDRKKIRDILFAYSHAAVSISPVELSRSEHLKRLINQTGSELERSWLRFLDKHDYHLPSSAQVFMEKIKTRPDFIYDDHLAAIYIDGPIHDFPDRAKRDAEKRNSLEDLGYIVIRFGHDDDWQGIVAKYPNIFGVKKES